MRRAIVLLFGFLVSILAQNVWGERVGEYLVDNKRIHVPAPNGFKNIIETPKGKYIAANNYPYSDVLAFFVPENVDVEKPDTKIRRYMVLTVPKRPQLRIPISPVQFIKMREGIKFIAQKDNAVVIYDMPRSIATMKIITNEPTPFVSIGATVLLPEATVTVQIKSALENENDKTLAIASIKNWIEDIIKKNPWRR